MTFLAYHDYFAWRARMIMAGRYDDVAAHTFVPLALGLPGSSLVLGEKDDVVLYLHRLRLALGAKGIRALRPEIIAVGLPWADKRVWLTWHAFDTFGIKMASAQSNYGLHQNDSILQITAMNHTTLLVPELAQASYRNRLIRSRG